VVIETCVDDGRIVGAFDIGLDYVVIFGILLAKHHLHKGGAAETKGR
jgi:hypothetical protein